MKEGLYLDCRPSFFAFQPMRQKRSGAQLPLISKRGGDPEHRGVADPWALRARRSDGWRAVIAMREARCNKVVGRALHGAGAEGGPRSASTIWKRHGVTRRPTFP